MKHILFISLLILGLWGCQDDNHSFDVLMPQDNLSFRAIPGGAVMHYKIPEHAEAFSIRVRYKDAQGLEMLRTGSYVCDSLHLIGFDEAQKGVEAYVTLCDRDNVESEPVKVTFDTEDSGPVAFFEKLEVKPNWHGFIVNFDTPAGANGLVHIFFLGESPFTQELDTLLLGSYRFTGGNIGSLQFPLEHVSNNNTVIIRTEDFRGYIVKQKVWENVESYDMVKLESTKFDFLDPLGVSIEDSDAGLGMKYLFDGDAKGETGFPAQRDVYKTFLAGPQAVGAPFIIDLKEAKQAAQLKLYAMLNMRTFPYPPQAGDSNPAKYGNIWRGRYYNKIPCKVTLYGTNDKDDQDSWEPIGSFEEGSDIDLPLRWARRCAGNDENAFKLTVMDAILAAEPCRMEVNIPASATPYRYLILIVDDIFNLKYTWETPNSDEYVSFHELEVFTKKD